MFKKTEKKKKNRNSSTKNKNHPLLSVDFFIFLSQYRAAF